MGRGFSVGPPLFYDDFGDGRLGSMYSWMRVLRVILILSLLSGQRLVCQFVMPLSDRI